MLRNVHIFTHPDQVNSLNRSFKQPDKICAVLINQLSIKENQITPDLFWWASGKAVLLNKSDINLFTKMCDILIERDSLNQANEANVESLLALYNVEDKILILALDEEDGFLAQFVFDEIINKSKIQIQLTPFNLEQIQKEIIPENLKKALLSILKK